MPFLPFLVGAEAAAKWLISCTILSAIIGGGVGGVLEFITGWYNHREVNHVVANSSVEAAKEGILDGTIFGGASCIAFGVAGVGISKVAAIIGKVFKARRAVTSFADEAARAVSNSAKAAADEVAGIADDTARGIRGIFNRIRNRIRARTYTNLPPATGTDGYVYAIKDPVTGLTKIGITNNPARRIQELRRLYGEGLEYVSIELSNNPRAAEAALHSIHAARHVAHKGSTEFFSLNFYQRVIVLP
ncbi:MAG: GIY-YIG nuclease family protein [Chloroflexi bacterium]|nr:GIY-YIG nuclease family protein [Chloroflexota bacterium]